MNTEELPVKELSIGLFLAVFFVLGFGTATVINQNTTETPEETPDTSTDTVSQEQVVSNGESYLNSRPLSYPFTYNLSTERIEQIQVGNTEMYNWTVSYTVESNPLQGPTYAVPGNQTSVRKTLNLYITTDGTHVFPSSPIKISR